MLPLFDELMVAAQLHLREHSELGLVRPGRPGAGGGRGGQIRKVKMETMETQTRADYVPWHFLPELVLVKLFSFLGLRERLAAGQVCRRWQYALSAAKLWRCVRVRLCGRGCPCTGAECEVLATTTALSSDRYAPLVRRLELRWTRGSSAPGASQAVPKSTLRLLRAMSAAGLAGRLQPSELMLNDLRARPHRGAYRGHVISELAAFLASQRCLEILSLKNAYLGVSEVIRLIGASARFSGHRIKDLGLHAAFREGLAPHTSPRLSRLLGRLTSLTSLCLDYPALSNETLLLLAECCQSAGGMNLARLSVAVRDTDNRQHRLSELAWARLVAACPHLQVAFNIENMAHHEEVSGLLLPSVPLHSFRLYSGPVWDQTRSREFRRTIRQLISYYSQSLESVQLHLKNSREQLDDLLLEMLTRCGRLAAFQFDGVLRRLDVTVREICRLRLGAVRDFHSILVRPKVINSSVCFVSEDITTAFQEVLAKQGVDFRMVLPSR